MKYGDLRWPEVSGLTHRVVVLPLGSLEQHGHHLPLLTDSMICSEIVQRAEAQLEDVALFLPLVWMGASEHHTRFPGTVSVRHETYIALLDDLLESVIRSGFKRILLLNAHGGNALPGQSALYRVQMRHRDERDLWLVFATWFELAAGQIRAVPGLIILFRTNPFPKHCWQQKLRQQMPKLKKQYRFQLESYSHFVSAHLDGFQKNSE